MWPAFFVLAANRKNRPRTKGLMIGLRPAVFQTAFFVLYSMYDALHQTESILYQVGDGADKSDRPLLYCRAGQRSIGPAGIWSSFFGDAASAGEFPGAAASFSPEHGLPDIGALTGLLAGGSFVGGGFADHGLSG